MPRNGLNSGRVRTGASAGAEASSRNSRVHLSAAEDCVARVLRVAGLLPEPRVLSSVLTSWPARPLTGAQPLLPARSPGVACPSLLESSAS